MARCEFKNRAQINWSLPSGFSMTPTGRLLLSPVNLMPSILRGSPLEGKLNGPDLAICFYIDAANRYIDPPSRKCGKKKDK